MSDKQRQDFQIFSYSSIPPFSVEYKSNQEDQSTQTQTTVDQWQNKVNIRHRTYAREIAREQVVRIL